jgi:DNA-binding transcriptional LysR family regulator
VLQELFSDRVEFVVSSAVRKRHEGPLRALIETSPLMYVPALRQVQYLLGALSQQNVVPAQHLPTSSLELVKSLTLDGVGVGVLPLRVASHGVPKGRMVRVSSALPHYDDTIALVRRYDMHRTAAARMLLDGLRAHGKAMPALPVGNKGKGRPR